MATHVPMAAARQPFAPLDSARLQTLTSLKNRQNALASPGKRKAEVFEEDAENIDPIVFNSPKKSKAFDGILKEFTKPKLVLSDAPSTPSFLASPRKSGSAPRPSTRRILDARTPSTKLSTSSISKATPSTAPAGRSPTRKRIGLLNRNRSTPFARVDPPRFGASAASAPAPFSIDAALSGTIAGYASRQSQSTRKTSVSKPSTSSCHSEAKASWFFDIHEDTAEDHLNTIIEHSTLTMDLSSDDEEHVRARKDRGKENVPPMDDASQTSLSQSAESPVDMGRERSKSRQQRQIDEGAIDLDRSPLGDLAAEDFYAEGCHSDSVVFVQDDEDAETVIDEQDQLERQQEQELEENDYREESDLPKDTTFDFVADSQLSSMDKGKGRVEELMQKSDIDAAPPAAVFGPIEKAEEGWTVYESDNAKDE